MTSSHAILAFALALLAGSIGIGVTYYLLRYWR
jgi:hypothetical protein